MEAPLIFYLFGGCPLGNNAQESAVKDRRKNVNRFCARRKQQTLYI